MVTQKMMLPFIPSPDVTIILNALLNLLERRKKPSERSVKVVLTDLELPGYFSQIDPGHRVTTNEQLRALEKAGIIGLRWLPGETDHLLHTVKLLTEHNIPKQSGVGATLYNLLDREPASTTRARIETTLLADQFRFSQDDWRTRAIQHTLAQLRAGKSPTPFSLSDLTWNLDLLTVLSALSTLETETPYRVFSVRTFNDSKRFDELKPAIARLGRLANREWKAISSEDILRELNLVANPTYIHLAGNWELTTQSGEILLLGGFNPSVGFPAAQIKSIQSITIHADSVMCIENLTSFHEFLRANEKRNTPHATLCLMGNPSPPIRRLLQLVPESTPIHLWSDIDYGGFNILSQLRRYIRPQIHPYLMEISTFEKYVHLSRPLTKKDVRNLKNLCTRPELTDIYPIIEHLNRRGLKLEQEALQF